MSGEDSTIRSTITTRSGELQGIFEKSTEEIDFLEYVKTYPTNETVVVERLNFLIAFALKVLRERYGFDNWTDRVLIVEGRRMHVSKSNLATLIDKLKAEGKEYLDKCSARSVHDERSYGDFANSLDKACGAVQIAIANNDMYAALERLSRAEHFYLNLRMLELESDYVRGKAQRGRYKTDWINVLADWVCQRHKYSSDRQCDLAMMEKHEIKSRDTIKSQRYKRDISEKKCLQLDELKVGKEAEGNVVVLNRTYTS